MTAEEERLRALLGFVLGLCEDALASRAVIGAPRVVFRTIHDTVRDELLPAKDAGEHERERY